MRSGREHAGRRPPRGSLRPRAEISHASVAEGPRAANEDAFYVHRGLPPLVAIADGAGRAGGAAHRALALFEQLVEEALASGPRTPAWSSMERPPAGGLVHFHPDFIPEAHGQHVVDDAPHASEPDIDAPDHPLALFPCWTRWIRVLDQSLRESAESTFLAAALLPGRCVGAYVGGDRAVLLRHGGGRELLTGEHGGPRLGSGRCSPRPIHVPVGPGDLLLLATDGFWKALPLDRLERLVRSIPPRRFGHLAALLVEEASRHTRDDDMTVVVVKVPPAARVTPRGQRQRAMAGLALRDRIYGEIRDCFVLDMPWLTEQGSTLALYTPQTRVRITVEPPREAPWGEELVRVHCESVVATRVKAHDLALSAQLFLDPHPELSALVYDPTWRRCSYVFTVYFAEAHDIGLFHAALLGHVSQAHREIDRLCRQLDARHPAYAHPHWGYRPQESFPIRGYGQDEPRGARPWDRADLDWLIALRSAPWTSLTDHGGSEVRGPIWSGGELEASVGEADSPARRHFRARLSPPVEPDDPTAAAHRAQRLNRREARSWTGFHLLGGWTVDGGRLVFETTIPPDSYVRALAGSACWACGHRSHWARGL